MLTIRLDKDLDESLTKVSGLVGRRRGDVAREALRQQLRIWEYESLRQRMMPFAEARGYLMDDDVSDEVS